MPFIQTAGELKTKPTQHMLKELLEIGIQADILLAGRPFLSQEIKSKIALVCNVSREGRHHGERHGPRLMNVPLVLAAERLDDESRQAAHLPRSERPLQDWKP